MPWVSSFVHSALRPSRGNQHKRERIHGFVIQFVTYWHAPATFLYLRTNGVDVPKAEPSDFPLRALSLVLAVFPELVVTNGANPVLGEVPLDPFVLEQPTVGVSLPGDLFTGMLRVSEL